MAQDQRSYHIDFEVGSDCVVAMGINMGSFSDVLCAHPIGSAGNSLSRNLTAKQPGAWQGQHGKQSLFNARTRLRTGFPSVGLFQGIPHAFQAPLAQVPLFARPSDWRLPLGSYYDIPINYVLVKFMENGKHLGVHVNAEVAIPDTTLSRNTSSSRRALPRL